MASKSTELKIAVLFNSQGAATGVRNLDKQVGDLGDTGTEASGKMTKGFGATAAKLAVLGAAAYAAKQGMDAIVGSGGDFEQIMADVRAVSGATTLDMAKLKTEAMALGSTTKFTATQVGSLQKELSKLGFKPQEIEDATEGILALAAATGEDLSAAASLAGGNVRAFGEEVDQTTRYADVMAEAFSISALDLQKFKVATGQSSKVAADANFDFENLAATLGVLADNNIRAETTGTGVRNILLKINEGGSELASILGGGVRSWDEFIERLQVAADDSEIYQRAIDAAGQESAVVFSTLVGNIDKLKEKSDQLYNSQGAAAEKAAIQMDTLQGSFLELKSASEGLAIELFESLGPAFTEAIRTITDITLGVRDFFRELRESPIETTIRELQALGVATETLQQLRMIQLQGDLAKYNAELKSSNAELKDAEDITARGAEIEAERAALIEERGKIEIRGSLEQAKQTESMRTQLRMAATGFDLAGMNLDTVEAETAARERAANAAEAMTQPLDEAVQADVERYAQIEAQLKDLESESETLAESAELVAQIVALEAERAAISKQMKEDQFIGPPEAAMAGVDVGPPEAAMAGVDDGTESQAKAQQILQEAYAATTAAKVEALEVQLLTIQAYAMENDLTEAQFLGLTNLAGALAELRKAKKDDNDLTKESTKLTKDWAIQAGAASGNVLGTIRMIIKAKFSQMMAGLLAAEIGSKGLLGVLTAGAGAAAASALFDAVVPSFAEGTQPGGFIADHPQFVRVGDNPGQMERVTVTPSESPNFELDGGPAQRINIGTVITTEEYYQDTLRPIIERNESYDL